jgi:hypothetical protein
MYIADAQRSGRMIPVNQRTASKIAYTERSKGFVEQRREGIGASWMGRVWGRATWKSEFKRPASRVRVELATPSP